MDDEFHGIFMCKNVICHVMHRVGKWEEKNVEEEERERWMDNTREVNKWVGEYILFQM